MGNEQPPVQRESQPVRITAETDAKARARLEAANGIRQIDAMLSVIAANLKNHQTFRLRPSLLGELNRLAVEGLTDFAGVPRPHGMTIYGSDHQPPPAAHVQVEVEVLCDYVNDHWREKSAVHLASYVMWRVNWIHPYDDGNGRTARAAAYIVLSLGMGMDLRGRETLIDQIIKSKGAYYAALEAADRHWDRGVVDVSAMEELLGRLLANQFASLHAQATGQAR